MKPRVADILIEAILRPEELLDASDGVLFLDGDLPEYAKLVAVKRGASERPRIVSALCEALESAGVMATDVTESLLELALSEREKPVTETPLGELDDVEIRALRAIADHGAWRPEGSGYCNFAGLVASYGVPDSRSSLKKYLDDP